MNGITGIKATLNPDKWFVYKETGIPVSVNTAGALNAAIQLIEDLKEQHGARLQAIEEALGLLGLKDCAETGVWDMTGDMVHIAGEWFTVEGFIEAYNKPEHRIFSDESMSAGAKADAAKWLVKHRNRWIDVKAFSSKNPLIQTRATELAKIAKDLGWKPGKPWETYEEPFKSESKSWNQ